MRKALADFTGENPGEVIVLGMILVPGTVIPHLTEAGTMLHFSLGEPLKTFAAVEDQSRSETALRDDENACTPMNAASPSGRQGSGSFGSSVSGCRFRPPHTNPRRQRGSSLAFRVSIAPRNGRADHSSHDGR